MSCPSFTERCHRSYLHSHTLATHNSAVNTSSPSIEAVSPPASLLGSSHWLAVTGASLPSFSRDRRAEKRHCCHLISITSSFFFLCVLNAKAKTFKDFEREPDRIMCWIPYAENYEVAFQFPPSITQLLSVMIWVPVEQTRLQKRLAFRVPSSSARNVQHKHCNLPACFEYACN